MAYIVLLASILVNTKLSIWFLSYYGKLIFCSLVNHYTNLEYIRVLSNILTT